MFSTIRKHQTWLYVVLTGATIVSFVIFFTPGIGYGTHGRGISGGNFGTIDGHSITRKEYLQARTEAQLALYLRYGHWLDEGSAEQAGVSLKNETRNRLVLINGLERLHMVVPDRAVAEWIIKNFSKPNDRESAQSAYEIFVARLSKEHGVTENQLIEFIRHDIGIAQLLRVAGSPGLLVTPREATELYRTDHEQVQAEAAVFSVSNYLASVKMTPTGLGQYFTNHLSVYRIPEQISVYYVRFSSSNYVAQAKKELSQETNLDQYINQQYLSSRPDQFVGTNGEVLPPAAAKAQIRKQIEQQQALIGAHRAAADFGNRLLALPSHTATNLVALAKKEGLKVASTAPFDQADGPRDLDVSSGFAKAAFQLNAANPISAPIVEAPDAVYMIALKETLPSRVPSLASIRARVVADFQHDQARQLAQAAGSHFEQSLTNGMAHGESFAAICAKAKVKPIKLPKFAPAMRYLPGLPPQLRLSQLQKAAAGKKAGQISAFTKTDDGGFILYVQARIPVTAAKVKEGLPGFLADLRQTEENQSLNEWFRREVEVSAIQTLSDRPSQSQAAAE